MHPGEALEPQDPRIAALKFVAGDVDLVPGPWTGRETRVHTATALVVRRRCIAGAFAAALAFGLTGVPGQASADPVDDAAQAADDAAAQVQQLLEQAGRAQVAVDDATARATRARQQYDAD